MNPQDRKSPVDTLTNGDVVHTARRGEAGRAESRAGWGDPGCRVGGLHQARSGAELLSVPPTPDSPLHTVGAQPRGERLLPQGPSRKGPLEAPGSEGTCHTVTRGTFSLRPFLNNRGSCRLWAET